LLQLDEPRHAPYGGERCAAGGEEQRDRARARGPRRADDERIAEHAGIGQGTRHQRENDQRAAHQEHERDRGRQQYRGGDPPGRELHDARIEAKTDGESDPAETEGEDRSDLAQGVFREDPDPGQVRDVAEQHERETGGDHLRDAELPLELLHPRMSAEVRESENGDEPEDSLHDVRRRRLGLAELRASRGQRREGGQ
jgi:hypothetical protein